MTQVRAPRYEGDLSVLDNEHLVLEAKKYLVPGAAVFPRSIAAEILSRVAVAGESGNVAEDIDPFLIAVAIRRIVSNYESGEGYTTWRDAFLTGLAFDPNVTVAASV